MRRLKSVAAICVSAGLLIFILSRIDLDQLGDRFAGMDGVWFGASLAVFVPVYLIRSGLLRILMGDELRFWDAFRSILAASALNSILPSKGGDLAKSFFLRRHVSHDLKTCVAAVVLERVLDVTALVLLLVGGLALLGGESKYLTTIWICAAAILAGSALYFALHLIHRPVGWVQGLMTRIPKISPIIDASLVFVWEIFSSNRIVPLSTLALILWLLHVLQFYCFFMALDYQGPWAPVLAYVPAAIFVGLIPITVAGIGTRDLALIAFFAPWAPAELAAGVGLLSHLRYLLPGLLGGFAVHWYLKRV